MPRKFFIACAPLKSERERSVSSANALKHIMVSKNHHKPAGKKRGSIMLPLNTRNAHHLVGFTELQ
jgi:hypothetical protein